MIISPGIGIALEDSVAVAPGRQMAVADAVVTPDGMLVLAAEPVAEAEAANRPGPRVAVAAGVAVGAAAAPAPEPAPSPPAPEPTTEAVAAPLQAAPAPAPAPAPGPAPKPVTKLIVANGEEGLRGWTSAVGAGNIPPRVATGTVRDGGKAIVFRLIDDQSRSQLILGGDGGSSGGLEIREGDQYAFAFSFYISSMVYAEPGIDNMMVGFRSDASDARSFGLQLWQDAIDDWQLAGRGLWASGEAMGGDRFLAPLAERVWHDAIIHFRASSQAAGFYQIYLDGQLIDARDGVSLIAPGSSHAQIEVGLLRDGSLVQGTSEIRLDAAELGDTLESVQP